MSSVSVGSPVNYSNNNFIVEYQDGTTKQVAVGELSFIDPSPGTIMTEGEISSRLESSSDYSFLNRMSREVINTYYSGISPNSDIKYITANASYYENGQTVSRKFRIRVLPEQVFPYRLVIDYDYTYFNTGRWFAPGVALSGGIRTVNRSNLFTGFVDIQCIKPIFIETALISYFKGFATQYDQRIQGSGTVMHIGLPLTGANAVKIDYYDGEYKEATMTQHYSTSDDLDSQVTETTYGIGNVASTAMSRAASYGDFDASEEFHSMARNLYFYTGTMGDSKYVDPAEHNCDQYHPAGYIKNNHSVATVAQSNSPKFLSYEAYVSSIAGI